MASPPDQDVRIRGPNLYGTRGITVNCNPRGLLAARADVRSRVPAEPAAGTSRREIATQTSEIATQRSEIATQTSEFATQAQPGGELAFPSKRLSTFVLRRRRARVRQLATVSAPA